MVMETHFYRKQLLFSIWETKIKKMSKTLFLFIFILCFSFLLKAQGPPTPPTGGNFATVGSSNNRSGGDASAVIVQPNEISKVTNLSFGNIAAGNSFGTVVIDVYGERDASGGVTLISAGNVSSPAIFDITGFPNATFTISLPEVIYLTSGSDQMEVINFVSDLGNSSLLNQEGEAQLKVGATLNVDANQPPGLYIGSFDVTVAYN